MRIYPFSNINKITYISTSLYTPPYALLQKGGSDKENAMLKSFCCFILWVFFLPASAQQILTLAPGNADGLQLDTYIQMAEDRTQQLSFTDIKNGALRFGINKIDRNFTEDQDGIFWGKISFRNETGKADDWIIKLKYKSDSCTFFVPDSNHTYQPIYAGMEVNIRKREIKEFEDCFKLFLQQGENKTVFFRLKKSSIYPTWGYVYAKLYQNDSYYADRNRKFGFHFFFLGTIFFLILNSLVVYNSIKDKSYIYYIFILLAYAWVNNNNLFFECEWFYPARPIWFIYINFFGCIPAMIISASFFIRRFVASDVHLPKTDKALQILVVVILVFTVMGFYFDQFKLISQIRNTICVGFFMMVLVINYKIWRKGYFEGMIGFIAAFFPAAGGVTLVLFSMRLIPPSLLVINFSEAGSIAQMLLLSFGLMKKLSSLRKEKMEAQKNAIQALKENEKILSEQREVLEVKVKERTVELANAKKVSDDLLHNILPEEIADELKAKGHAEVKEFDNVTVLFTDFVNFTGISRKMEPKALIAEINYFFKAFDNISTKYQIEKIKTIGDAYMAAAGVPIPMNAHAEKATLAALEMRQFVQDRITERKQAGEPFFEIRIGLHSGAVIAGIVGHKKFTYDNWGDTVNTASRMEKNSDPGGINISEATYQPIAHLFHCTYRGNIEVKNRGKVEMYFVHHAIKK